MQKLLLLVLCYLPISIFAQVDGLWTVEKVLVGDRDMTPTGKWYDLKKDGQTISGNGGIINQRGSWEYDKKNKKLLFRLSDGQADPAGPFTVQQEKDHWSWSRTEEGMQIKVLLKSAKALPLAPWDLIQGNWKIDQIYEDNQEVSAEKDPEKKFSIYVRWDNLLNAKNDLQGRKESWAVWQIHGHRAELRLVPIEGGKPEIWKIQKLDDQELVLAKKETQGLNKLVFKR